MANKKNSEMHLTSSVHINSMRLFLHETENIPQL